MSSPHSAVYDRGLQPERTLLAWRRTCLSFGVASLIAMRFTAETFGLLAVFGGLLGAGLAVIAYTVASLGYRRAHTSLHDRGMLDRDGRPLLCATAAVAVVGILCGAAVLGDLLP